MSEFISIQVGQCGNQIGSALWPQILNEYGIADYRNETTNGLTESFFYDGVSSRLLDGGKNHTLRARAVLIDMEDGVVSAIKRGPFRDLYDPSCILTSYPGSGNNWATGYYEHGGEQRLAVEEVLRSAAEKTDRLHGFLGMFSLAGGTGSGLGTRVISVLSDYYSKVDRFAFCVHPGDQHDVVITPYNVAFSTCELTKTASCVFPFDNKALLDISLRERYSDPENSKPYEHMNSIICRMILDLTCGSRFPGSMNLDMNDLSTNLVPFKGLNFLCSSLYPFPFPKRQNNHWPKRSNNFIAEVCSRENQLLRINGHSGTLLGACLAARGAIKESQLRDYAIKLKKKTKFITWSTAIKLSLCSVPPAHCSSSLLSLNNSSAMKTLFLETLKNFDRLYKRKAHVHHYSQVYGFPPHHFETTRESLLQVIDSYDTSTTEIKVPRRLRV